MKRIFVGNLSFDSAEDDIRRTFEDHGEVESVQIMTDRDTGRSRGFAFVEMGSDEQAEQAIAALDGAMLDNRALRVNEALPREDRGGGGGRPEGGRSRRGGRGQRF
jgi:RNA recognition motif-containing protein